MSDNERETPDDFEKKMKELLTGLSGEAERQKGLRKRLFRSVFSADDINRCLETVVDVAIGSLAKLLWHTTKDGHSGQAEAFKALGEVRRNWRLALDPVSENTVSPPPLSAFFELTAGKKESE